MNKLLIIVMLALSTTVSANEITIGDFEIAFKEDISSTNKAVGGLFAYQDACKPKLTGLGQQVIDLVAYDGIENNYFFQEGYSVAAEKVEKFGCWVSKFLIKNHEIGQLIFK